MIRRGSPSPRPKGAATPSRTARTIACGLAVFGAGCGAQEWSFENDASVEAAPLADALLADTALADAPVPDAPSPTRCTMDRDCMAPGLVCDSDSGLCVACLSDMQCKHMAGRPRCDAILQACVQCQSDDDCIDGELCEQTSRRCIPTCGDGGSCPSTAPNCDTSRGVCMQCTADQDCAGDWYGAVCDTGSGTCVQCTSNGQCQYPTARCNLAEDRCVGCLVQTDCRPEQVCDPFGNFCRSAGDGGV